MAEDVDAMLESLDATTEVAAEAEVEQSEKVQAKPKPKKARKVGAPAPPPERLLDLVAKKDMPKEEPIVDLAGIARDSTDIRNELLEMFRADREQIQTFIDMIKPKTECNDAKAVHTEALVSLLTAKSMIPSNAIKIMDAMAKLMAAGKSTVPPGRTASQPDLSSALATFDESAP